MSYHHVSFFTEKAVPQLYEETNVKVLEALTKAIRLAPAVLFVQFYFLNIKEKNSFIVVYFEMGTFMREKKAANLSFYLGNFI